MNTHVPNKLLGNTKTAEIYAAFISDFSERLYANKDSVKLAKHTLEKIRDDANWQEWWTGNNRRDFQQWKKPIAGAIFELMFAEMLIMHGLVPFYTQVKMWKVPMSRMDFLLYNEDSPVVFTCKISLAERWRQAAFEGMFLKNVYRRSKCYLISANEGHVNLRKKDIANGDIDGIDDCFLADSRELQSLLINLSKREGKEKFSKADKVNPIQSGKLIP